MKRSSSSILFPTTSIVVASLLLPVLSLFVFSVSAFVVPNSHPSFRTTSTSFISKLKDVSPPTSATTSATALMGGGSGYATTLQGKQARVETLKQLLDQSEMIFAIPGGSITVKQAGQLRRSLPEGTTMMTIKNTLMERAIAPTTDGVASPYAASVSLLTGQNTWFFIQDDISGTIKAYNAFLKETKKEETNGVRGGVMEGTLYDASGVERIGKLPTKLELYAQMAGAIQMVPTKLARVIKAPGNKLARAIRLATMPENDDTKQDNQEQDSNNNKEE